MGTNGILGVVFVPLAVKLFGVSGYGLFSIYSILASYVVLVDLGVSKNFLLLIATENDPHKKILHLRTAFGIYIILSIVLLLLLPLFIFLVPRYIFVVSPENIPALRWIVVLSFLEYILTIPTAMTQISCIADEHFDRYSRYTFVSGLYRYGLMFLGIIIFRRPEVVVGLVVSRRFLDAFVSRWLMVSLPLVVFRPRIAFRELKLIVSRSASLSVYQVFQSTVVAIGSVLVNRRLGLNGLGIYRSAFDLANKIWFLSNGIGLVIFPRFAKILSDEIHRKRLSSRILWMLNISWIGYSLLSVLGIISASRILSIIGLTQPLTLELFILLLLGVSWNAHTTLSYEFLQASARFRLVANISVISLLAIVSSYYLLESRTGLLAIGWAWVISQAVSAFIADGLVISISEMRVQKQLFAFKTVSMIASISIALSYLSLVPFDIQIIGLITLSLMCIWSMIEFKKMFSSKQAPQRK